MLIMIKPDINQQDLKIVDRHFVKSGYFSLTWSCGSRQRDTTSSGWKWQLNNLAATRLISEKLRRRILHCVEYFVREIAPRYNKVGFTWSAMHTYIGPCSQANAIQRPNVALKLDERLQRWPNIKPALFSSFVFDGEDPKQTYVQRCLVDWPIPAVLAHRR